MRSLLAAALAIVATGFAFGAFRDRGDPAGTLRIAFVSAGAIDEIDLSGGHRRVLESNGAADGFTGAGSVVSPNVFQLVTSVWSPTHQKAQLWIVNVNGSGRRQLTSGALDRMPAWSPDGSTILFTRFASGVFSSDASRSWIETVPAIGGTPRRLTSSGYDSGGGYAPDGRWIAFGSARDRRATLCGEDECRYLPALWLMRADGGDQHRISRDRLADSLPVFATQSTIVYSRVDAVPYRSELYRIESDGTCRRRLTYDALPDSLPMVVPGTSGTASRCPPGKATLPRGPNFNAVGSTLTPSTARTWRGVPLYWIGRTAGPFVLTEISVGRIQPPGQAPAQTAYLIYACSPARGDCSRRLQLIMTPLCARPTFPAFGGGAVDSIRGVPRIRYADRDELLTRSVIITLYGDRSDREVAERELRSLSASAGRLEPSEPLWPPPRGILGGLACQPPAISPPLPAHP
jgi:WD40-like Beta Propeller Repeat